LADGFVISGYDEAQDNKSGAAQIWSSYHILAQIAEQEAESAADPTERRQTARDYRRLSRAAYRAFPGNPVLLKQFAALIVTAARLVPRARPLPIKPKPSPR